MGKTASIVVRTLNESKHLPDLFEAIGRQDTPGLEVEVVVVDSGSTDGTLEIAERYGARIVHIRKEDFSFGRSLNVGCRAASGAYLVFISGHCIPVDEHWLFELVAPLSEESGIAYSYGRQVGAEDSRFSECRIFEKYFPDQSAIPQEGFFVNNANSALLRSVWETHPFDEELTGLEDMALAKRLQYDGYKIAYVAEAPVYHIHEESWRQVRWRYEREAIALQRIMPEVHVGFRDFVRYFTGAVFLDLGVAVQERKIFDSAAEILRFRMMQFWGSYRGNHEHRKLSRRMKEKYFYPR